MISDDSLPKYQSLPLTVVVPPDPSPRSIVADSLLPELRWWSNQMRDSTGSVVPFMYKEPYSDAPVPMLVSGSVFVATGKLDCLEPQGRSVDRTFIRSHVVRFVCVCVCVCAAQSRE